MINLQPLDQMRLQRGVQHLHALGPRATAEAFAAIVGRIGGLPTVLNVLGEFSTVTRRSVVAAAGDRFPPRALHVVPRQSHVAVQRLAGRDLKALS